MGVSDLQFHGDGTNAHPAAVSFGSFAPHPRFSNRSARLLSICSRQESPQNPHAILPKLALTSRFSL